MAKGDKKSKKMSKAEKQELENRKRPIEWSVLALEEELEEENRITNFYEQERERINYIWISQKRKIEDLQADPEAKNQIEKKLYYQKIKYVMLKEQDENIEL